MLEKKVIVTVSKGLWEKFLFYVKTELWSEIGKVCVEAWEKIKEFLWTKIKEDVKACAVQIIKDAEAFLTSVEAAEKEEAILDAIMAKIELPLLLKPFKKLVRNIIKGKLEDLVKAALGKGKELVG